MATNNVGASVARFLAPGLHVSLPMKRLGVAMMMAVSFSGCGVGVDEGPDGEPLGASEQALVTGDAPTPRIETPTTTVRSNPRDPSLVALPQDPDPLFEGKPMAGFPTFVDGKPVSAKPLTR